MIPDKVHGRTQMEVVVQVERRVPHGLRWTVVNHKLNGGQNFLPVRPLLSGMQGTVHHHFDHPIHCLSLTVCLRVVRTGHPQRASQNAP